MKGDQMKIIKKLLKLRKISYFLKNLSSHPYFNIHTHSKVAKRRIQNNFTSETRQRQGGWKIEHKNKRENRKNETKIKLTRMEAHTHTPQEKKDGNDVVVKKSLFSLFNFVMPSKP
jgi:hypothetical protein